jgi:hypothetical protein
MLRFERRSNKPPQPGWLVVLVLAAVFALLPASPAWAGRYHVYSCRTPGGAAAPTEDWNGTESGSGAEVVEACGRGGSLLAGLRESAGRVPDTESATWKFAPPSGDELVGATLWRAGDVDGGFVPGDATDMVWLAGREPEFIFDVCSAEECTGGFGTEAQPLSESNQLRVSPADLGGDLYATAACRGLSRSPCAETGADANGYAAAIYLYAADLILEQQAGPTVGDVGGELASAGTVGGAAPITFSAGDPLSGIYEVVFSIDGQVVQTTVPSEDGGRCRNVGETSDGLPAFLYVEPCPQSLNVQVALDTTTVANGPHHLAVTVVDAAGNPAPVLEREITVHNAGVGPPNGVNATAHAALSVAWSTTKSRRLVTRFGRAATVEGRLTTTSGAPIAGASVDVSAVPSDTGARTAAMPEARTNASGHFTVTVPGGVSSRTLRFGYRTHLAEENPAVTSTLALVVRAGIALHVSPAVTSVGRSIYFSGRLLGGPIPADGKQLVLEARSPGGPWIEFQDVRCGRRGHFRSSYRFKFAGPADYQFRVISEPESDYPYGQGASNLVAVFER